jgi:hypothetical protein
LLLSQHLGAWQFDDSIEQNKALAWSEAAATPQRGRQDSLAQVVPFPELNWLFSGK